MENQVVSTAQNLTGAEPGLYTLTITDVNGCTESDQWVISEPDLLVVSGQEEDYNNYQISCNGSDNGIINTTTEGGAGGFTYEWVFTDEPDNVLYTDDNVENLAPGNYTVTVTDVNGCTDEQTYEVTEPPFVITINAVPSDFNGYSMACNGQNDGTIETDPDGGAGGFTYEW